MFKATNVQIGTYKQLGKDVGVVAAVNSDSNMNVSVYLSERDKYKTEFNSWSKKTAQSTLEMCRVVFDAKKELGSQDFLKFCNEIGRKGEDATVRKYLKIGEKYDKFYQYAELLPNSWTSIYEITQLPSETFEALVATENSLANITGDQLKQLMGKKTEDKSKTSAASAVAPKTTAPTTPVLTTITPANAVPQTAQTTQEAHEDINAASSKTELSSTATASSDAIQNDSSESVKESTDEVNEVKSSQSTHEFAKQATSTMLERVAATAMTTVEFEAEEVFEPYEITIRFNKMPSDEAKFELAEYVYKVKNKYRLDIEIVNNYVEV
ncbi:hypothetical protein [Limnohabitans sp. Rim28]|uniref:hypothetical protein n=1 Tax=Limnohabitans sp. Rim28 TaxID=1100720 RepID=UPI00031C08D3|nr:hypothetical protein [Limnohabitans sp. Rim28]PVE08354.1 hypothetical protein B472_05055 [Limnohabitans sp. Rim28]